MRYNFNWEAVRKLCSEEVASIYLINTISAILTLHNHCKFMSDLHSLVGVNGV